MPQATQWPNADPSNRKKNRILITRTTVLHVNNINNNYEYILTHNIHMINYMVCKPPWRWSVTTVANRVPKHTNTRTHATNIYTLIGSIGTRSLPAAYKHKFSQSLRLTRSTFWRWLINTSFEETNLFKYDRFFFYDFLIV